MLLLPSTIHSSHLKLMVSHTCTAETQSTSANSAIDDFSDFTSWSFDEKCSWPKMQVFEKYGCYYALDSNVLKLYQKLQSDGQCDKVSVDVVPKKKIPPVLWEAAYCSACPSEDEEDDLKFGEEPFATIAIFDADGNRTTSDDAEDDNDSLFDIFDDDPMCIVCGMQFCSIKDLTEHQVLKRHFGCPVCGEIFPSCKKLEKHEQLTLHGFDSDLDD